MKGAKLAKLIKYDVTDVEESGGGTGVKAKPGLYAAKIMKCAAREEKRDGTPANDIEVALNIGEEYDWLFTYIGLSKAADWKLKEFTAALGLPDKGGIDTDKLIGKMVRVKVNPGTYEGQPSPSAGRLMKAQKGDEPGPVSAVSATAAGSNGHDATDDEPEAAVDDTPRWREGQPDPDNPDELVGSYDEWEDEDVFGEVTDRDLTLPGGRGGKRAKAIAALRADDEAASAEPEPDAEPDADDDGDYEAWSTEELVAEYVSREFDDPTPEFKGRNADKRQRDAIITALTEDDQADPFTG